MKIKSIDINNVGVLKGKHSITLNIIPGEPMLIIGANGIGKSTIFDALTLVLYRRVARYSSGRTPLPANQNKMMNEQSRKMEIVLHIQRGEQEYKFRLTQSKTRGGGFNNMEYFVQEYSSGNWSAWQKLHWNEYKPYGMLQI